MLDIARHPPLGSALVAAVLFRDKFIGVLAASFTVDTNSFVPAPLGEGIGINVGAFDDAALTLEIALSFLRALLPLLERIEQRAILEDRDEACKILLPKPSNVNNLVM